MVPQLKSFFFFIVTSMVYGFFAVPLSKECDDICDFNLTLQVHVISRMNEVQYEHFKSVMNGYIEESFHATLAHR